MKTYLIASGKGGVGKSTVAVNLSVSLSKKGFNVGLLDADLYGPSIPIMLGLRRLIPRKIQNQNHETKYLPFNKFGIQSISIGYFIEESESLLWRGPMLHNTLKKLIEDVEWGHLDILIIDLPPGTGDVPISLSKLLSIQGAIIVSTPQEVAILDAKKAANSLYQLDIPLTGVIENMAGYEIPTTHEIHYLFGKGHVEKFANHLNIPLLGTIPLIPAIGRGGDEGYPAACHMGDHQAGLYFDEIANTIINNELCEKR